jgi:hypothetical protein
MLGGLLLLLIQPILAAVAVVSVIGLIIFAFLAFFVPGGWLLVFGARSFMGFFRRILVPVVAVMLASLVAAAASSVSPVAGYAVSFLVGGVLGTYVVSRLGGGRRPVRSVGAGARPQLVTASPPEAATFLQNRHVPSGPIAVLETRRRFMGKSRVGLPLSAVRSGVIVLGEEAIIAARAVISSAVKAGMRVVVIGSPYMAPAVEKTKLISFGITSVNILKPPSSPGDRLALRRWAENIAVPLAVANGLDTAEAGMLVRFFEKFSSVQMKADDVDKLVAEYGPTGSARLKDAIGMVSTLFGEGYPEPAKLFSGDWSQLVIDLRRLSPASQLFIGMYLLYESANLFPRDCVIAFDSAELGLPELQILPYDARHVWLRTLKTVERMKGSGFVMASSTGLLAPELMDLADTYVITRGPSHLRRAISERVGQDVNPAAIPVGGALVYTRAVPKAPLILMGEIIDAPFADIAALEQDAEREAKLLREELLSAYRDTLLYAELGDAAELGYNVLKAVKRLQTPTDDSVESYAGPGSGRVLTHLLEKGYVVKDPSGVLGLTSLGEHAVRDWESKAEHRQARQPEHAEQTQQGTGLQTGLSAFTEQVSAKRREVDFGDVYRLIERSRTLLLRGESITAVGTAYKAAVSALKRLTGVEKGHLHELAAKAAEMGLVKVDGEEARRLYAANIEAKRLSKQAAEGQPVSEEDRKRLADAAELLISLAERVVVFSESLEGGVGEDGRQHVDGSTEPSPDGKREYAGDGEVCGDG